MTEDSKVFLRLAGMPEDAAPFLAFHEIEQGCPRIYEYWGVPEQWDEESRSNLRPYRAIGADGSGNPICIDESRGGQIVFLDHDDWFQTILFVNSSIVQLAEFLLAYREMVFESTVLGGPDTYLNDEIPTATFERARRAMLAADASALETGTFWSGELGNASAA